MNYARPKQLDSESQLATRWALWVAAALFLVWLAIIWFWPVSIYTLTVDDSYYYLKTADNAAHGFGFSFDRINPTNGFHPLWMAILVPLSWVNHIISGSNMETFAHLALTLQLGMVWAGSLLLSRALGDSRRWLLLATAILLVNFYFAKILVNGLESGAQWLCLCATLAVMLKILNRGLYAVSDGMMFALGVLAGFSVLARLSAVLFAAAVLLTVKLVAWKANSPAGLGLLARRLVVAGLGVVLMVAPYLSYNYFSTGHFLTVSAAIKTSHNPTLTILHYGVAIAWIFVWFAGCFALWCSSEFKPFSRNIVWAGFPLLTYAVLQTESDILLRGAVANVEIWYMVPQALLATLFLTWVFYRAAENWRAWRWPLLAGGAVIVALAVVAWNYRLDPQSYASYLSNRHTADWLKDNTSPDAVVAGWDVGIVGAFSDRSVENLDGLINSWNYKENYLDKHHTEEFITDPKAHPVDYIAQYFWDDELNPETLAKFRDVNLLKWNVVFAEKATVRAVSNDGRPRVCFFLVLSRQPEGTPLAQFIRQNQSQASKPPLGLDGN